VCSPSTARLQIIETLAEDDEGYSPQRSRPSALGLSTSTAHRLLTTLEKRRFVQFDRTCSKMALSAPQSFAVRRHLHPPAAISWRWRCLICAKAARCKPGETRKTLPSSMTSSIIVLMRRGEPGDHAAR